MGGEITQEMIRRRSEHNECVLYTMEELVLQEESIERIDKTLGILCPHLKILYMPNNLIPRLRKDFSFGSVFIRESAQIKRVGIPQHISEQYPQDRRPGKM